MGIASLVDVRKQNAKVPVVVMMKMAPPTLKKEIQSAGATAFLTKSDIHEHTMRKYLKALGFNVKAAGATIIKGQAPGTGRTWR